MTSKSQVAEYLRTISVEELLQFGDLPMQSKSDVMHYIHELERRLRLAMAALAPLDKAADYYHGPDPRD